MAPIAPGGPRAQAAPLGTTAGMLRRAVLCKRMCAERAYGARSTRGAQSPGCTPGNNSKHAATCGGVHVPCVAAWTWREERSKWSLLWFPCSYIEHSRAEQCIRLFPLHGCVPVLPPARWIRPHLRASCGLKHRRQSALHASSRWRRRPCARRADEEADRKMADGANCVNAQSRLRQGAG